MPQKKKKEDKGTKIGKGKKQEEPREAEKQQQQQSQKEQKSEQAREPLPPLDFSSLFLPFYTQALIRLGQFADPITQKEDENLELAKRLIDLLDLLKDRTKGNLKPEEDKLLENSTHQLKLLYMEKAKIIKL